MYPEDPRQPFYDMDSSKMTPLARLYIRKEKQITRACDAAFLEAQVLDVSENAEDSETSKRKIIKHLITIWKLLNVCALILCFS